VAPKKNKSRILTEISSRALSEDIWEIYVS